MQVQSMTGKCQNLDLFYNKYVVCTSTRNKRLFKLKKKRKKKKKMHPHSFKVLLKLCIFMLSTSTVNIEDQNIGDTSAYSTMAYF